MSAAILQGVPATTLDTDIWVDLPERKFVRLIAIIQTLGGTMLAPTVAALEDDSLVNFLPRVDGLASFANEYAKAKQVRWLGTVIPVLPLASIIRSKKFIQRPKDLAHLPLLEDVAKLNVDAKPKPKRTDRPKKEN